MVRRWLLSEGVLELGVVDDIRIGKGSRQSFHVPKCYGLARRCSTWSIFVISALLHCCCAGSKTSLRTSTFVKWLMFSTPPLSLASDEDANKAEDWRRKYNHLLRRSAAWRAGFFDSAPASPAPGPRASSRSAWSNCSSSCSCNRWNLCDRTGCDRCRRSACSRSGEQGLADTCLCQRTAPLWMHQKSRA